MANALNTNIEPGTVVVVRADALEPKYADIAQRLFVCKGGFGMSAFTMGAMISGTWQADGEGGFIRGEWIDVTATLEMLTAP